MGSRGAPAWQRTARDQARGAPARQRMARDQARGAGHALLERLGLAGREHDHPDHRLRGGRQRRVAIVRALRAHPRVLLLDAAASALDPELVGEVLAIMRELKVDGMRCRRC